MLNQHAHLDPQSPESRLAFVTPEECAEYEAWLDQVAYARDSAGDIVPEHVDGSASNQ